jgi:hypothetical protein
VIHSRPLVLEQSQKLLPKLEETTACGLPYERQPKEFLIERPGTRDVGYIQRDVIYADRLLRWS